jgi:hypothetical protein
LPGFATEIRISAVITGLRSTHAVRAGFKDEPSLFIADPLLWL